MGKGVINTAVWSSEQQRGHAVQDKWPHSLFRVDEWDCPGRSC